MTSRNLRNGVVLAVLASGWMGASVFAQNRRGGQQGDTGETAVARPSSPAPAPAPAPAPGPKSTADRGDRGDTSGGGTRTGGGTAVATPRGGGTKAEPDPGSRRGAGDAPVVGRAVPREPTPRRPGEGGTVVVVPAGIYPWGYGGLGFGGFYGGYLDPWYDPYGGGYPPVYPPVYSSSSRDDDGAVRIKVKPRDASVYSDGYYVGRVDDFDGVFQKLHLDPGPHRIEIRDSEYETLTFDVRIDSGQTVTYRGEMKKI